MELKPWSSRKLWTAIYFAHFWALLVCLKVIDGDVFSSLEIVTIGGYFLGNVGEHWAKR